MYIGKLGDGASADDGIYILVKEIVDNSIDEFVMGNGKRIDVKVKDGKVTVRDFGRGIPLGKVIDCVSQINTGGKYDSKTVFVMLNPGGQLNNSYAFSKKDKSKWRIRSSKEFSKKLNIPNLTALINRS
jgi:DNA gyrase/topoisomerase IV subunit B